MPQWALWTAYGMTGISIWPSVGSRGGRFEFSALLMCIDQTMIVSAIMVKAKKINNVMISGVRTLLTWSTSYRTRQSVMTYNVAATTMPHATLLCCPLNEPLIHVIMGTPSGRWYISDTFFIARKRLNINKKQAKACTTLNVAQPLG